MTKRAVYESLERFQQTMRDSVDRKPSITPAHDLPLTAEPKSEPVQEGEDVTKHPVTRDEFWDYVSAYATRKHLKPGQSVMVRASAPECERIISTIKAMASHKHGKPHSKTERKYDVEPVQTGRLGNVCRVTRTQ